MDVTEVVIAIAAGVAAGAMAGLFGVGGGIVFVPTLTLVLGLSQLHAEATSLLAIIPVAAYGSWLQTRQGTVRWRDAVVLGVASIASAVGGAFAAEHLPEDVLRYGFAALLLFTAWQLAQRALRQKA